MPIRTSTRAYGLRHPVIRYDGRVWIYAASSVGTVSDAVVAGPWVASGVAAFYFRRRRRRERDGPVFGCGRLSAIQPATSWIVPRRSRAASSNCVARGV